MGRSHQWPLKQKSWITKNRSDKGWAVRTKPYIIVEEISPERGVRGSEKKNHSQPLEEFPALHFRVS